MENINKNKKEQPEENGELVLDPLKDIEFSDLNIKCIIDKVTQTKQSIAREMKEKNDIEFLTLTTTNADFINCKPLKKENFLGNEETIDKKKRAHIKNLHLVYEDEEKINEYSIGVSPYKREILFKTKLETADNKIAELNEIIAQKQANNIIDDEYNSLISKLKDFTLVRQKADTDLQKTQSEIQQSKRDILFLSNQPK